MGKRPTEEAKGRFGYADRAATQASIAYDQVSPANADQVGNHSMAVAMAHLARGLNHLSDGLRATYILLEDVKQQLDRQNGRPR
jgi:hypothetical protein